MIHNELIQYKVGYVCMFFVVFHLVFNLGMVMYLLILSRVNDCKKKNKRTKYRK